jgi:hypothetical protein
VSENLSIALSTFSQSSVQRDPLLRLLAETGLAAVDATGEAERLPMPQ